MHGCGRRPSAATRRNACPRVMTVDIDYGYSYTRFGVRVGRAKREANLVKHGVDFVVVWGETTAVGTVGPSALRGVHLAR